MFWRGLSLRRGSRGWPVWLVMAVITAGCQFPDVIRDLRELPQDHCAYLRCEQPARPLAAASWQEEMEQRYLQNFFLPWRQEQTGFTAADVESSWLKFAADLGGKQRSAYSCRRRLRKAVVNAGLDGYPNVSRKGITVAPVDLRYLPLSLPPGNTTAVKNDNGLFLDRLQVSSAPPGTPVHISHYSRDGAWALVETGFALGWTKREGLAVVTQDFMNFWERGPHAAIIKDKTPFYDPEGRFLYRAPLGSLFPVAATAGETLTVYAPVPGKGGTAEVRQVALGKGEAAVRPLPLTAVNLAALANELLRDPYGWGGRNERRDCSSLIRDLYSPFGIWLPRHSADQAREGGTYLDLSGLSPTEKKKLIVERGVPYLTLLWLKGHIMIYIGAQNGEPLVFHSFLSIRTMNETGQAGRKIIGRASITSLYPGREFNGAVDPEGPYLGALRGMTLIGPPASPVDKKTQIILKKEMFSGSYSNMFRMSG